MGLNDGILNYEWQSPVRSLDLWLFLFLLIVWLSFGAIWSRSLKTGFLTKNNYQWPKTEGWELGILI